MKRKIAAGTLAVALAVGGLVWASPAMAEEVTPPAPEVTQTEAPAEGPAEVVAPVVTDNVQDTASEKTKSEQKDHKWYVCKYVGTPGVDERLQTGQNPIFVDEHAIEVSPVVIGATFSDKHGKSVVIAGPFEKKQTPEPSVSDCPAPQGPHKDPTFTQWTDGQWECGDTTVVQTAERTDYAYTLEAGAWVEHTTVTPVTQERALSEDEIIACPPVNVVCEAEQGPAGTNLNGLWSNVDTRSAGHFEYVEGALHVWTDDNTSNAKVSLGTSAEFALKNTGELGIEWEGTTPPPGVNLFVDFDNDGSIDGTLVFETVYGQDLWLTNGSKQFVKDAAPSHTGGNGSENHGTINEWLMVYPDAQVKGIAFSLGSGVLGDGLIKSITVGCKVYTFGFEREVPAKPEPLTGQDYEYAPPVCIEPLDGTATVEVYVTTWTQDYTWNAETWEWVLGEKVYGQQVYDHYQTVPEDECKPVVVEPEPKTVMLGIPVIDDACGTSNDLAYLPDATEGVTYTWATDDETDLDMRAVVDEGYVVKDLTEDWVKQEDGSYLYDFVYQFTNEECTVTTPEPTPTPTTPAAVPAGNVKPGGLAATGGGDVSPLLPIGGALVIALGITLTLMRRFARR